MAKSRKESIAHELASLKVEKNKEKAEQQIKDLEEGKVKYKAKRQVIDKKPNGQIDISYEDTEVNNKKPRKETNVEKNELKRDVITNELAKILGGIEHKRSDVSIQLFKEYLDAAFKFNEQAGKNSWKVIQESLEKTLNRYRGDKGTLGITDGKKKGVFEGHEEAQKAIQGMLDYMEEKAKESGKTGVSAEDARQLKELAKIDKREAEKFADELLGKKQTNKKSETTIQSNSQLAKEIATFNSTSEKTFTAIREGNKSTEKQTNLDKIENVREAIADNKEQTIETVNRDINKDTAGAVKEDAGTGFNTDSKAEELIGAIKKTEKIELPDDITSILKSILTQITAITTMTKAKEPKRYKVSKKVKSNEEVFKPIEKALVPVLNSVKTSIERPKALAMSEWHKIVPKWIKEPEPEKESVQKSKIYASPFRQGIFKSLEDAFMSLTGATRGYEKVLNANAEEQDKMAAKRIEVWGLNNGRNPNDTGDIAGMRRILQLYRTNKASIEQNPELRQKIKLTPGVDVDTTELTKAMNKALSGRQMKNAQNGGGFLKNAFGFMTGGLGYALLPSLEKSRAQADGLNQMFGNINKALQSVLINIQTKETELAGMEKSGQAKFDKNGYLTADSTSAAFKTLADLEEEKYVLETIKADLLANDEIIKRTGGRFSALVKNLSYTSPVLKENNGILRNINSGLDKNGKALKFQTRMAEILNYTYQLMSRSIGQMIKNWITMLNPINLVKKAFSDFGSYDVKWQRTMNVIKINFQRIIKPAMEWIAQKLVNIIGYFDVASQAFQRVFGKIPISLFDQAGADAEKIRREMEEAANVTLGFDELHDIGTDNSGANDLLGDIYKPQLDPKWVEQFDKLGEVLGKFFKGDLGFGEVCKQILKMLGMLLGDIGKAIWNWFKETAIGKWITEHWKGLLASLLAIFLGWQLLKIFGPTLLSVIGGAFKTLLTKVGGWITTLLGASGFGQGIMLAFQSLFAGGKYSLLGTLGEMFTNSAAITEAGSWGSMIGFALVKGLVGVLSIALGGKMVTDAFDSAADKTSYNIGLEQSGGKDEDKKGTGWDIAKGAAGGAAIGFGIGQIIPVVGPLVGAAIGAVAGALTTALAPAFEAVTVKAKEMNNEMQKIEYYEGVVQGASTQVENFTELQNLMSEAVENQTNKVYAQGEQLGISRTRMEELVKATQDGTFNTDLLTGSEIGLSDSLIQLSSLQEKNKSATEKLTEAKKKLQKAEMDLAIAQDIEAGNFEMAAARIEVALASEVYDGQEAGKKMAMILKDTNNDMSKYLLDDMSPDLKKNWEKYVNTTDQGKRDMIKMYANMNDEQKKAFEKDYASEYGSAMQKTLQEGQKVINNTSFDWSHPFKSLKSMFTGNWSWKADYASFDVGTNYVPNDGFAYIHKGEAIIPADENVFAKQGAAWQGQTMMNDRMMSMITSLEQTLKQGINVSGEFRQRGSDLVAVTEKAKNRNGHQPLNNPVFAR